jgi:hypothetical protein
MYSPLHDAGQARNPNNLSITRLHLLKPLIPGKIVYFYGNPIIPRKFLIYREILNFQVNNVQLPATKK